MSELTFLGSIALLYLMLAISPGPNFLVITTSAMSQSRRHALCVALGVSSASVFWAGLAAAGLGLLLAQFAWLHRMVQVAGGAYLLYLGVKLLRSPSKPQAAGEVALPQSLAQAYRYGLLTNLTNPKSLAFFSSAFATLFAPGLALWAKVAAVLVVAAISLTWNVLVVSVFSVHRARQVYSRAKPVIDRLAGGLLAYFGVKLMLGR